MASSYPAGLDTISVPGANLSGPPLHSTVHDEVKDAIEAIEATLGINPQGGSATVVARLNAIVGSKVLQVVNTQTGAVATGTTTIPYDDTIPQNTEGDQYMSLAITPVSASSYLLIEVEVMMSHSAVTQALTVALFVDSTANALAAMMHIEANAAYVHGFSLRHYVASGSTSARTYKVRAGAGGAGTTTFNGQSGARKFGGITLSSITITEIAA